jgi:signal transduction histidine kinase
MDRSDCENVGLWTLQERASSSSQGASSSRSALWSQLPPLALFGIGYFIACKYSQFFSVSSAAPLWLPDSVLLCAFLLTPRKRWISYVLIGLPIRLAHFGVDVSTWFLAATYANDCLKALFSACLLQRLLRDPVRLNTLRQFTTYFAVAGLAAPALSALAGAGTRFAMGFSFWPSFSQWFLGDFIAALVLTPTLLYWFLGGWRQIQAHALQFAIFVLSFVFPLYLIFLVPQTQYYLVALYAPVPFLIFAATRFKPIGVSTAISMIGLISIVSSVKRMGPFFAQNSGHELLSMQLFLAVISVPMLFVAIVIEERHVVERDLHKSRAILDEHCRRIEDLAGKLLRAQDHERENIARELHDDISQRIALLSVNLDQLHKGFSPEMDKERSLTSALLHDAESLATDIHDLSHQLHSSTLRHMGLQVALKALCRNATRQHHIDVELQCGNVSAISQEADLCLFRVAQEALNNAVKHGKAKRVEILLHMGDQAVCMKVRDTGAGFDPGVTSDGLGLVSMQERLRFLGGKVQVKSKTGVGTEVIAELPLRRSA